MRRRKVWLGLLGLAVHTTLLVETAHADRRSALGGNILIEDPDDLFPFPQYTLQHRNMIRLDYGASSDSGNGVLTLGNDAQAVGIAVHRGDLLTPDVVGFNQELAWRGGVGNPFGSTSYDAFVGPDGLPGEGELVLPATVVDLSYARAMGRDAFGARVGFGRGVQAVRTDDEGVSKGAQTFFAAQLGYSSLPAEGLRYDLSGNLVFAFGKVAEEDVDVNTGWNMRLGALGRAYYPINQIVDVGFIGNVSLENEHTKSAPTNDDSNAFDVGLMGGVGPVIRLDRAKIASYAGVRFGIGKTNEGAGQAEYNRLRFAAPMVNMAVEVQVLDWLYVRTGAEYSWQLDRQAAETEKARIAGGALRWAAGLGLQKGAFYFDGVVQNAFVTGGPNFIGGNANGFLAIASLTYKFGDVFGNAPESTTPAPATRREQPIEQPALDPEPVEQPPEPTPTPVVAPPADPEAGFTSPPNPEVTAPAGNVEGSGSVRRGGRVGASGSGRVDLGGQ